MDLLARLNISMEWEVHPVQAQRVNCWIPRVGVAPFALEIAATSGVPTVMVSRQDTPFWFSHSVLASHLRYYMVHTGMADRTSGRGYR